MQHVISTGAVDGFITRAQWRGPCIFAFYPRGTQLHPLWSCQMPDIRSCSTSSRLHGILCSLVGHRHRRSRCGKPRALPSSAQLPSYSASRQEAVSSRASLSVLKPCLDGIKSHFGPITRLLWNSSKGQ